MSLSRRALVGSVLAVAACKGETRPAAAAPLALPPLKVTSPLPIGVAVMSGQLTDAAFQRLVTTEFSQLTPEYEMKMETVLKADGSFDFRAADAIAAFASAHRLRLHGHTLIWYDQSSPAFRRIDGQQSQFANAYRNYILAVAGRYRGRCSGWDVVNEPVAEDGNGYRDCLWRKNLGMDYVAAAFRHAREAEPAAPLFMNDYNLETNPAKRKSFLRLAETLLKAGAPLSGLGSQTHLDADVKPGQVRACIRDLASLGLPIHLSELDISTRGLKGDAAARQARLYGEAAEAMVALPARQRYALTVWGARDRDSWLRRPPRAGDGTDRPLLFDDDGRAKPATEAFEQAFSAKAR